MVMFWGDMQLNASVNTWRATHVKLGYYELMQLAWQVVEYR